MGTTSHEDKHATTDEVLESSPPALALEHSEADVPAFLKTFPSEPMCSMSDGAAFGPVTTT